MFIKIKYFLQREPVFSLSFCLAVLSMVWVPVTGEYWQYMDTRTLSLLFCLMAVVAGFEKAGLFRFIAVKLLAKTQKFLWLAITLVLLCFFFSMVITNDVALLTFVPFTITTLKLSGYAKKMIPVVVLQTIAANLGSMLTPLGNPQNLYIFSYYHMAGKVFFCTIFPYAVLSLLLLLVCCWIMGKEEKEQIKIQMELQPLQRQQILISGCLFCLALTGVFRLIPHSVCFAVTLVLLVVLDRESILRVDYSLLATFVCLFIFIGNLGKIPAIHQFLSGVVRGNEVLSGVVFSQVFSNVPAAVLLSAFTKNAADLLIGVNLGGLGTLIASMASLISFKIIAKEKIEKSVYLLFFTKMNLLFLLVNLVLYFLIILF